MIRSVYNDIVEEKRKLAVYLLSHSWIPPIDDFRTGPSKNGRIFSSIVSRLDSQNAFGVQWIVLVAQVAGLPQQVGWQPKANTYIYVDILGSEISASTESKKFSSGVIVWAENMPMYAQIPHLYSISLTQLA